MDAARQPVPASPPIENDPAGVFRFASGVVALAASGATVGLMFEKRFSRASKVAIGLATAAAAGAAAEGFRRPSGPARALLERPILSLFAGALPVAAAPVFGRRFNALHMLSITGTGIVAAVEGEHRHRQVALMASGYWVAQCLSAGSSPSELARDDKLFMNMAVVPLSFWAVARITPDILVAARELGMLNDKLSQTEKQVRGLAIYRERLTRAVDQAREGLLAADRALDRQEDSGRRRTLDTLLRSVGRLDERSSVLEVADDRAQGVQALLQSRIDAFRGVTSYEQPPEMRLEADPDLAVADARVLALLGSATTTALSNALRHAQEAQEIVVRADKAAKGWVRLRVENDGQVDKVDDAGRAGRGLGHLRWQAEGLDGTFSWGPREPDGWMAELVLPVASSVGLGPTLTAERMVGLIDDGLRTTTRITAAMVLGMAWEGRQLPAKARRRSKVIAAVVCFGYEALDRGGLIGQPKSQHGGNAGTNWETAFLAGAAVSSAFSPHHEHSLWSGWANSAVSRYGLRADRRSLGAMTLAHVGAIAVSFRGGPRDFLVMASHQMTIPLLGPLAIYVATSRALSALSANERALQESQVELAQMHDLAESFHIAHPVTTSLDELRGQLREEPEVSASLDRAKALLTDAARALPSGLNVSEFADQFAQVVATRLWPAEVTLERDDERLAELDAEAAMTVDFRRPALEVADRLGDRIAASFPPDWLARPRLHRVRLRISAHYQTDCIQVQAIPNSPGPSLASADDALAASLARAGGTIREGFGDGRMLITLGFERYRGVARVS